MSTTPITNIYHPDNATPAQDVTTLGAMADSIETAMLNLPRKFANFTALEAWTPTNGALAFVQSGSGRTYQRVAGAWQPILGSHVLDDGAGRSFFSSGNASIASGESFMTTIAASDASGIAIDFTHDGLNLLRLYKSGNALLPGNVTISGDINLTGNLVANHLPRREAAGQVTMSETIQTFTYPSGRFTQSPYVFCEILSPAGAQLSSRVRVTTKTATGFNARLVDNPSGSTVPVMWHAVQMEA